MKVLSIIIGILAIIFMGLFAFFCCILSSWIDNYYNEESGKKDER